MELLPRGVVARLGEAMDYRTRRGCVIAHRSLAPVMESFVVHEWCVPASGGAFDADAKARALLKYKPRLGLITLVVHEDSGAGWAPELVAAIGCLRLQRAGVDVEVVARNNDAALLSLMDELAAWWPAGGAGVPVRLHCTLQRFTTALGLLEHCGHPRGWVERSATLEVRECVTLADGDAARVGRLLEGWRARAGEHRWTVDALSIAPRDPHLTSSHERPLLETAAASALRELLPGCCRTLKLLTDTRPSLLSGVASVVQIADYVHLCSRTYAMLEHLAGNERLEVLELGNWDARTALYAGGHFDRALRGGRAQLRLVGDAVEDMALPGLLRHAATRFPVCLRACDSLQAFLARQACHPCHPPDRRFGVSVEYVGVALEDRLQDVPLSELARRLPAEVDPERLLFFSPTV